MLIRKFSDGFSRQRFLDLDDWEMLNVLGRPDFHYGDHERGYWPMPRTDPEDPIVGELGMRGLYFHPARAKAFKLMGMSKEEQEAEFSKWASTFNMPGNPHGR